MGWVRSLTLVAALGAAMLGVAPGAVGQAYDGTWRLFLQCSARNFGGEPYSTNGVLEIKDNQARFTRPHRRGDSVYTGTVAGNRLVLTGTTPPTEMGQRGPARLSLSFDGARVTGDGEERFLVASAYDCRVAGGVSTPAPGSLAARAQPPAAAAGTAAPSWLEREEQARAAAETQRQQQAAAQRQQLAELERQRQQQAEAERQRQAEARAAAERDAAQARVREVQEALRALGLYTGAIDGEAGRGTREAVLAWQRAASLPLTGTITDTQLPRLAADARRPDAERRAIAERGRPPQPPTPAVAAAPAATTAAPASAPAIAAPMVPPPPVAAIVQAPPVAAIVQAPPIAAIVQAPPIAAAAAAAALGTTADQPGKRVALVVGIGKYQAAAPLPNPPNDARAVHAALTALGFDSELVEDTDRAALEQSIRRFSARLDQATVALFFYAGHGMQVGAKNYILPTDVQLKHERDLRFEAVDLDLVLDQMESARRVNLVFLDACRDNPLARSLARSMGTRSSAVGTGLAAVQTGSGTLIAYATQPGNVAEDGLSRHSPFTAALLEHMKTPGIEVRQMLTRVRASVRQATNGRQVPWDHSSLESDFFFVPVAAQPATSVPRGTPATDSAADLQFWTATQSLTEPAQRAAALRAYLEAFPTGRFASIARIQLDALPPR